MRGPGRGRCYDVDRRAAAAWPRRSAAVRWCASALRTAIAGRRRRARRRRHDARRAGADRRRRRRGRPPRAGREARRPHARRPSSGWPRWRREHGRRRAGRLQPPLPPVVPAGQGARRRRPATDRCCTSGPATATAAGSATSRSGGRSAQLSGGGELLDQGSHLIDLTRHLAGDVELAFSELRTEFWAMEVEDNAFLALRTARRRLRVAPRQLVGVEEPLLVRDHAARRQDRDHRARRLVRCRSGSTLYEMRSVARPARRSRRWEWPPGDDSWALEVDDVLAELDGGPTHRRRHRRRRGRVPHHRRGVRPMIITRTPLRISLGGGGTDLPSFYGATAAGSSSPPPSPSTSTSPSTATSTTT